MTAHAPADAAERDAVARDFDVSRETLDRLDVLVAALRRWSPAINLVARSTLPHVWRRHIVDSAQLFRLAPAAARSWIDLGAGGGLPSLVIAALAAEKAPALRVTAVESDGRKCAFMAETARAMGVSLAVKRQRVETLGPEAADVVSARALAPLDTLLGYAHTLLAPGGVALFPKGARHAAEVLVARENWTFTVITHPSATDSDASILEIREIADVRR